MKTRLNIISGHQWWGGVCAICGCRRRVTGVDFYVDTPIIKWTYTTVWGLTYSKEPKCQRIHTETHKTTFHGRL